MRSLYFAAEAQAALAARRSSSSHSWSRVLGLAGALESLARTVDHNPQTERIAERAPPLRARTDSAARSEEHPGDCLNSSDFAAAS
jgi:hypothetical protein